MNIQQLVITDIKPYNLNAKKHPQKQIQGIAESIKLFGWKQPVVIDKDFQIIAGHGRVEAAKLLNLDSVPCIVADDLSEREIKAFRILDNKLAESGWDNELLLTELELLDFDFSQFNVEFEGLKSVDEVATPAEEDTDQFIVIIDCKNETTQQNLYEELEKRGFACKLMM